MSISRDSMMFIIYVKDQDKSKDFYKKVFQQEPVLDIEGISEFALADNVSFGIMPESGIMRILDDKIPNPAMARGIPRNELYLYVNDIDDYIKRVFDAGGKIISGPKLRNWGKVVAYCMDIDGNILAFAKK